MWRRGHVERPCPLHAVRHVHAADVPPVEHDVVWLHHGEQSLERRVHLSAGPIVYSRSTFSLDLRLARGKYVLFIGGERLKSVEL